MGDLLRLASNISFDKKERSEQSGDFYESIESPLKSVDVT